MKIFILKKVSLPILLFCFNSLTVISATKTYVGPVGGNWGTAANWSLSGVPAATDDVIIPNGKSLIVNIANAACKSLVLQSGGNPTTLTIALNNILTVNGNVTINDGDSENLLDVKDGTLNITGSVLIYGNGNKIGKLIVNNGTVNVTGDFGFATTGDGQPTKRVVDVVGTGSILIGGSLTNPSGGTIDEITQDHMFVNLSFRTRNSGTWTTPGIWELKNFNNNWVTSSATPGKSATSIEILTGHIVTGLPVLSFTANSIINIKGTLDCGVSQLTGTASFTLEPNSTLKTAHLSGLSTTGSIQVTGTKSFNSAANYEFSGASTGTFTTTPLPQTCNNLTINNASGVNLSSPLTVNGSLSLTNGVFNAGVYKLTLNGTTSKTTGSFNSSATGEVVYNSNSSAQNIVDGTYGKLTFSSNANKTALAGNINISANWSSAGGKIDLLTNSPIVNFNGTTQTLSDVGSDGGNGVYFKKVTFSNSGTKTISSGKFSVASNGVLTMEGNSTLAAGGNLYLKSDINGSANVAAIPSTCSISGNVNVESWFTGGAFSNSVSNNARRGTRTLSSPVKDSNPTKSVYMGLKDDMIITGTGTGFDYTGTATLLTYNEPATYASGAAAQYIPVTDISAAALRLKQGEGFFLFYRGDKIDNLATKITPVGAVYATPESFAITYKGEINQGSIPVNLSYTGTNTAIADLAYNGFNLVGNPYPATIDWKNIVRTAGVDNMVSIIKPGGGMTTYSGGFVVNPGVSSLPAGTTVPANTANSFYIQPGQGFYVRARSTGQSITFSESSKAVLGSPTRLLSMPSATIDGKFNAVSGSAANTVSDDLPKAIYFELSDQYSKEETAIVFKEGNDAAFGADDATYFPSSSVALSTLTSDGKSMAINFMPDLKDVKEIKLSINASVSGPLKLNFKNLKAASCYQVFLKDALFPDELKDVKANPVYEFSIDKTSPATYGTSRFTLIFTAELIKEPASFTAQKVKNNVELNWFVEYARDIGYFEIETSGDGAVFKKAGEVKTGGAGLNVQYSFMDKTPVSGLNYYRVKQVNKNGAFIYTPIKSIVFSVINEQIGTAKIIIYPNPATERIQVQLPANPSGSIEASISNLNGKKLVRKTFAVSESLSLQVAQLKPGIYILELNEAGTKKLINRSKFTVGL